MNIIQNLAIQLAARLSSPTLRLEREEGQTLAEYALILALIAIIVIGAVTLLGHQVRDLFSNIGTTI